MCIKNRYAFITFFVIGLFKAYIIYRLFIATSLLVTVIVGGTIIGISNYIIYAILYYFFINYISNLFNNLEKGDLDFQLEKSKVFLPQYLINQLNKLIKTLNHKIYYDNLTLLPNRSAFLKYVEDAESYISRNDILFLFDIDDFKLINDNYGHQAGDNLLKLIGTRLINQLPSNCTAFRLSGDEFIIVMTNSQPIDTESYKTLIHSIFDEPFTIDNKRLKINISIGSSTFGKTSSDIFTATKNADNEMYNEKNSKKKVGFRW